MAHSVLITDSINPAGHALLEEAGLTLDVLTDYTPDELVEHVRTASGWIVRSGTTVTAELIEEAENLQVIGRAGVGVDNIDLEAATREGVLVCNAPGGNTISTAEHACAMMQATARQLPQAYASLRSGKWERKSFAGAELYEKTLGIIGVGRVGRAVAERMQSFEMDVLGFDPVVSKDVASRLGVRLVGLEELLRESDFISVHAPLNNETRGLIGADELALCKPEAILVNCARGALVDEEALVRALDEGQLGGAALDVYSEEPPPESLRPLVEHPKVVATPHIAATTGEAQAKVARQTAQQVIAALRGEAVRSPVNGMGLKMAAQPEVRPFLTLADRLGQTVTQLAEGQIEHLTVACYGERVGDYAEVLTLAALKGALGPWAGEPVNLINAPILADELGLRITETRDNAVDGFTNLVEVTAESDTGESQRVAGTVFRGGDGQDDVRLVRLGEHDLEVRLDGHFLFYRNADRPGMLARVSGLLAEANVNVAALTLGRTGERGQMALTALRVDDPLPEGVLEEVAAVEGVEGVRAVEVR